MGRMWFERIAQNFQHVTRLCFVLTIFVWTCTALSAEENPQSFTYQGRFLNAAGNAPLADGTYSVKFGIYDPSGSCLLYEEIQNVTTTNGFFSAQVGSTTASAKRTAN